MLSSLFTFFLFWRYKVNFTDQYVAVKEMIKAAKMMIVNFHHIVLISSNLLRIKTAPGTKNIPMLSMKNLLTSSMEWTFTTPTIKKMNKRIMPINEPGKLTFAKLNKYETSVPKRAKPMMMTSCLKILMYQYYNIFFDIRKSKILFLFPR